MIYYTFVLLYIFFIDPPEANIHFGYTENTLLVFSWPYLSPSKTFDKEKCRFCLVYNLG